MIQIEHDQAQNGQPILRAVDPDGRKILLHSRYDPERETQQWCDQLECKERDVIVLYGLGLGYHVSPLLSRQNRPIFAVEPNAEVIDMSRKLNPAFFDDGDIHVVSNWEEFKSAYLQTASPWQNIFFAKIPSYPRVYQNHYLTFTEKLKRELLRVQADRTTAILHSKSWQTNFLKNIRYLEESAPVASAFNEFVKQPVIIVSGGPSLTKNLHLLKEAKGKALILAVGAVVKLLIENGIRPDLILSFDGNLDNYRHFEGLDLPDVTLIYDPIIHYKVVEEHAGPKSIMIVHENWLEDVLGNSIGKLLPGPSIANTAFDFAYRLGADPIIFIGQDLSYEDSYHAEGIGTVTDNRELTESIQGQDGNAVRTSKPLLTFLHWFEERFRSLKGERTIINATEGGANIRGTQNLPLLEALKTYCNRDLTESISRLNQILLQTPAYDISSFRRALATAYRKSQALTQMCNTGARLSLKLIDHFSGRKTCDVSKILKKLNRIDRKLQASKSDLRPLVYILYPIIQISEGTQINPEQRQLESARHFYFLYWQLNGALRYCNPLLKEILEHHKLKSATAQESTTIH